jgi:Helicase associated domain
MIVGGRSVVPRRRTTTNCVGFTHRWWLPASSFIWIVHNLHIFAGAFLKHDYSQSHFGLGHDKRIGYQQYDDFQYSNFQRNRKCFMISSSDDATQDNVNLASVSAFTRNQTTDRVKVGWNERYRQLDDFLTIHGHTMVPKRYKTNPALGNWVSKQRQQYHKYTSGTTPCSLTPRRIELLNQIHFCWNAAETLALPSYIQEKVEHQQWWSRLEELHSFCSQNNIQQIPRHTRLGVWLHRQRKAYEFQNDPPPHPDTPNETIPLTTEQVLSLSQLDPDWWMTRRQWQWETRLRDLQRFADDHGHCCVPISYRDKQLAHWVSNQRKQYNLRVAGKRSELTTTRIQNLESIGFVWNRWEYEFDKKHVDWK